MIQVSLPVIQHEVKVIFIDDCAVIDTWIRGLSLQGMMDLLSRCSLSPTTLQQSLPSVRPHGWPTNPTQAVPRKGNPKGYWSGSHVESQEWWFHCELMRLQRKEDWDDRFESFQRTLAVTPTINAPENFKKLLVFLSPLAFSLATKNRAGWRSLTETGREEGTETRWQIPTITLYDRCTIRNYYEYTPGLQSMDSGVINVDVG